MSYFPTSINPSTGYKPIASSRLLTATVNALRLIFSGRAGLLISIPMYRLWWRLRGLDFGAVSLDELGLNPDRANYHKDGGGPLLRDVLNQLTIGPTDVALDLGSGKGGAMATLAEYPFQGVDGVEISPPLVDAARGNLQKLKLLHCRVFLADATTFTDVDTYTHVFMYNPFPEVVLRQVLANLTTSLQRRPRSAQLIYSNPLHERAILESGTFVKTRDYTPYPHYRICVYESSRAMS
jgi:SAM-dependent methyltransferase